MAESLSKQARASGKPRDIATSARLSIRQSSTIKYWPAISGCRSNRSSGTVQKKGSPEAGLAERADVLVVRTKRQQFRQD